MSVLDTMRQRCSVRNFRPDPIEREKLEQVLEAGHIAPSACNRQPWRFVVVQETNFLERMRSYYSRDWIKTAPAIIVILGCHNEAWHRAGGKDLTDVDAAIAIDHMTLAATELGLGTCWICSFDTFRFAKDAGLPEGLEPIALLPIGYPAEGALAPADRHATSRKPIDSVAFWDTFDVL